MLHQPNNNMNKYLVWVREGNGWVEQGDGPLTLTTAERIAREIRQDCHVRAIVLPVGVEPKREPAITYKADSLPYFP